MTNDGKHGVVTFDLNGDGLLRDTYQLVAGRLFLVGTQGEKPTIRQLNPSTCELRCETLRGFLYKLQTTTNLPAPFVDDPSGFVQALDSSMIRTDSLSSVRKFYRFVRTP